MDLLDQLLCRALFFSRSSQLVFVNIISVVSHKCTTHF